MDEDALRSRGRVARLAGALYLLTMATALFAEAYVRGTLLDGDSAAQTARNIAEAQGLFRVGLASDLLTYTGVVVLVWALHQLLRPVDARLALLALCFRLVELGVHVGAVVFGLAAASLLGGGEYTRGFDAAQLQTLAGFALRAQGAGLVVGFIPLGIGSAIFALLFLRSGGIPRALAVLGIVASLMLAAYALLRIVAPDASDGLEVVMLPMFVYEVGLGLWLLARGVAVLPATGRP